MPSQSALVPGSCFVVLWSNSIIKPDNIIMFQRLCHPKKACLHVLLRVKRNVFRYHMVFLTAVAAPGFITFYILSMRRPVSKNFAPLPSDLRFSCLTLNRLSANVS